MTTDTADGGWQEALATPARAQARTEDLLAAAQARTDEQLAALAAAQRQTEERLQTVAAAQARTDEQLATLTERVDRLTARVEDLTIRLDALTARVDALTEQMAALVARFDVLTDTMGEVTGWTWELRYRQRARAYLGGIVRRIRVLSDDQIAALVERGGAAGNLSEAEADDLERVDLICRGPRKNDAAEVYLATEVSAGVGLDDVKCVSRRADLLARKGMPALAVVAGQWVTPEAGKEAAVLAPEDQARRSANDSPDRKRNDE
jgi:polyhydroxyalkanoate synthesis regulator phasin